MQDMRHAHALNQPVHWSQLIIHPAGTHHIDPRGEPAYAERFDHVLAFHEPGLAPARHQGRAFHIHPDGTPAYAPWFHETFGFYGGLAAVRKDHEWFHIDARGEPAYASRWRWAGNFQNDLCVVQAEDGLFHHVDATGVKRTGPWQYAGDFREGAAAVRTVDRSARHITTTGAFLHDHAPDALDAYHKGWARARDKSGWYHIDRQGRAAYAQRYRDLEPFYNGRAIAGKFDGSWCLLLPDGTEAPLD